MLSNNQEFISLEALAEILSNLLEQDFQRIISLVEHSTDFPDGDLPIPSETPCCPHCSRGHVHHNGFVRGKQQYICKGCGRTFGQTTGSVRYKSKHSKETWETYLEAFALRLPLREALCKCDISLNTAFF